MNKAQTKAKQLIHRLEELEPMFKGLVLFMPYEMNPNKIRDKIMHEEINKQKIHLVDLGYPRKIANEYFNV